MSQACCVQQMMRCSAARGQPHQINPASFSRICQKKSVIESKSLNLFRDAKLFSDTAVSKTLQTHQQYIFSQVIVTPCAVCDCRGKKVPISCCAVDCVVCVTPARLCVCVRARADVHVTACSFPGYGVFRCACYDISVVNRLFVCAQHNGLCVPARSSHPLAYPLLPAASPRPPQSFWDFLPQLFPVLGNCTNPSPLPHFPTFSPESFCANM